MQANQKNWSMTKVLVVSAGVGVVVLLLLKLLLGFAFWAAFFWGLVIGGVIFAILALSFLDEPGQGTSETDKQISAGAAKLASATSDAASKVMSKLTGKGETASAAAAQPAPVAAAPAPKPAPDPAPAPSPAKPAPAAPATASTPGTKPATITKPRGGKPDDLKQIKGIGPKLEQVCNAMGYYHFDQIAAWGPDEVAWVDENLEGFKGRVSRDTWVEQAKLLASGGETEFSKKVGKGGVY